MKGPFSGREGKTDWADRRGCVCTEKHGGSDKRVGRHGHKPTTYVLTGKWGATEEEDWGALGSFEPGSIPD